MQRAVTVLLAGGVWLGLSLPVSAQVAPEKDNIIDGELYPKGYAPMEIKDGVYPRVYIPSTEKLGPEEMRVVALQASGRTTHHPRCPNSSVMEAGAKSRWAGREG